MRRWLLRRLYDEGRFDGILALGGSGGSSIATAAMRALPVGVPKLMVSTMASGDTRPYVGATDVTMMYSVVDIAGVNSISRRIMTNAAGAIAGMVGAQAPELARRKVIARNDVRRHHAVRHRRPRVARRARLRGARLPRHRHRRAVDGGRWSADGSSTVCSTSPPPSSPTIWSAACSPPGRTGSTAAGRAGIPQVVSLGALDMVNFGPRDTVPEQFERRQLYQHNPTVTLMRTTPEEVRSSDGGSGASSRGRAARRSCSCRCAECR